MKYDDIWELKIGSLEHFEWFTTIARWWMKCCVWVHICLVWSSGKENTKSQSSNAGSFCDEYQCPVFSMALGSAYHQNVSCFNQCGQMPIALLVCDTEPRICILLWFDAGCKGREMASTARRSVFLLLWWYHQGSSQLCKLEIGRHRKNLSHLRSGT